MAQKSESQAIAEVDAALAGLKEDEAARVLRWAIDKYGGEQVGDGLERPGTGAGTAAGARAGTQQFADIADLVTAASPKNGYERVLVVAYWFQEIQGQADVTGQQVNSELNHLGHRSANITDAFSNLMSRKPALATQTKKSGKSRQARKRYKLTKAGADKVRRMLSGTDSDQ